MINISEGELVFNSSGADLDQKVRIALDKAATAIAKEYDAESIDLQSVTTKTNLRLAYVKYVRLYTLAKPHAVFDESYVLEAFEAKSTARFHLDEDRFYRLTLADPHGKHCYRPSYRASIGLGLGFFLVALHSLGAVTLPFSFNFPMLRAEDQTSLQVAPRIASELLCLVRSVGDKSSPYAAALRSVMTLDSRQAWFRSVGTKLVLALGWHRAEDVNLKDLLEIKHANDATNFSRMGGAVSFRALAEVLERHYGDKVRISVRDWDAALRVNRNSLRDPSAPLNGSDEGDPAAIVYSMRPSDATPSRLSKVDALPGLSIDFASLRKEWTALELIYLRKLRLESTRERIRSLSYFNLYLFFYLPYWFDEHPDTQLSFPSTPSKLIAGIFVSELIPKGYPAPLTYLDFFRKYGSQRSWTPSYSNVSLKGLELFFEFLEKNSKELPGCESFVSPLAKHDYLVAGRSSGTNKRPVPRRIFAFYVAYVESLVAYCHVVLARVLAGEISGKRLQVFSPLRNVIDTLAVADMVGYVPMVFFRGKAHCLRFIPNCIDLGTFDLKDGRTLRIPQPHGLHHVLVAIYTGLRNQHIQWLDARTFDSRVHPDDVEVSKLLVNTDKVKTKSWDPHVNMRVIEILREQLRWRNLIDCAGFGREVAYAGNFESKWPPIQPLFAADENGYPHPDSRYTNVWSSILMGVQGMLQEIDCGQIASLFALLPSDIPYHASDRRALLDRYKDSTEKKVVLFPKSEITPHSARVGVVSHLIAVLPAEIIGKYVTGQTSSVVYHYVHIDEDDMRAAQERQAVSLQILAYGKEFDTMVASPGRAGANFIKADNVHSNLSRAMRQDMDATIASYGCVTLSLREDGKNGIDVLRETRGVNASFNKTEICPFGNHCPPDVLRDLRGIGRCGMCSYAVRSIDHLPPVVAKVKQCAEQLESIEQKLDALDLEERYSDAEQQQLEAERQRIGDDLVAWQLSSEVLEARRRVVESGQDSRRWVVAKPEIIEQALRRLAVPSGDTAYVLARLAESVAYPTFDSPEIKARFDLLRRQLLANVGDIRAALTSPQPTDVASQCAGLLRSVVDANGLDYGRVLSMLTTDRHLQALSEARPSRLLGSS